MRKKLFSILLLAVFIFAVMLGASSCGILEQEGLKTDTVGSLCVFIIDCGQGDAIYAELPGGGNLLIDGGPGSDADKVLAFLKSRSVDGIDFVVATHPHEDHIGGLDDVLGAYAVGEIFMPDVTATTTAFLNLLDAIEAQSLEITVPESGEYIIGSEGSDLSVVCLAPNSPEYSDTNNYSIVLKISYKNRSVLLTGDACEESELEQLSKGYDLSADVIKIGHHGSSGSSSEGYIDAVSPEAAVISCGKDNSYGHPSAAVLSLLEACGITVYRTDTNGTVAVLSDGTNLTIYKNYA